MGRNGDRAHFLVVDPKIWPQKFGKFCFRPDWTQSWWGHQEWGIEASEVYWKWWVQIQNTVCLTTVYVQKFTQVYFQLSFLFSKFCMYMTDDFLNLSVCASVTLNFSVFLVFIWCNLSFFGKRCLNFGWLDDFFAKFMHNLSLLSSKLSRSRISSACSYDLYLESRMILKAVFCTLSKSVLFSSDNELCHTVADCSRRLLNWLFNWSFGKHTLTDGVGNGW